MTRAIQKITHRYSKELNYLPLGVISKATLKVAFDSLENFGYSELGARLRVLRQLAFLRLYQLDCEQGAALRVVMQGMTDLAEFCIAEAVSESYTSLMASFGMPQTSNERMAQLWVIGMGKLGARELNVSSDIDLIYVYDADGHTKAENAKQMSIPNHDFFAKQVRAIQTLLADVTEHGFVFRVDLALRPYGRDGALALSLSTLAQYFQRSGREWERFAWLKSRVIGGVDLLPLRSVIRSFVFRRFLDHKVFVALRGLHQLIRQNADLANGGRDVKLGRGGIREIEFAAQVQQIVRGGRQPELLARPTLQALKHLMAAHLMDESDVNSLSSAYEFLRRVEHRIQYLDDMQTHILPRSAEDLAWISTNMGFVTAADFERSLEGHRSAVEAIFGQLLQAGIEPVPSAVSIQTLQAKARWTVSYVRKHPDVVDELNRTNIFSASFNADAFKRKVLGQYQSLQATGLCDDEAMLDLLRRAHHIELFRILVRDVQGLLSVRDVGDELSALAETVLALALRWCSERLSIGLELEDHFAVIAYGKLGGKELGYGSDLDVVFLYDSAHVFAKHEAAAQKYVALVRKLITWLTVKTGEGDLYEIDTALRPNGNSGLLVTSLDAYERYQLQRGSNAAWTWELQAMTRARCAFGSKQMHRRFEDIRRQVLVGTRDPHLLRQEIVAMRTKLYAAYPVPAGQFDIKHSPGGMMDAEFSVQCLVLIYAKEIPELIGNVGNIALLQMAQAHHLLPDGVGTQAADAYQLMRDKQHAFRLQEEKPLLLDNELLVERDCVIALWQAVFEV